VIVLVFLFGLLLGTALSHVIAWQLRDDNVHAPPTTPLQWLPVIGAVVQRAWLPLAVELLTAMITVGLWQWYGWTSQFWLLLAASLVLIDTAAIDWKVKLIDTLVMMIATVAAVALAPVIGISWRASLLGLLAVGVMFVLLFFLAKLLYPGQAAPFGLGDVYLGMFIGALLGLYNVGPALFYGMLLAGLVSLGIIVVLGYKRARHVPISYGTFLCLGVLLRLTLWSL
jgi:leader peptidase (prepilin peptidase) / N-methyltransferase